MNRETLRGRLLSDRKAEPPPPPTDPPSSTNRGLRGPDKENGAPAALWGSVEGRKLKEAATYLASARAALLHWTRDTCLSADNLDTHAEHLEETLGICATLKKLQGTIEFKSTLYGEKP